MYVGRKSFGQMTDCIMVSTEATAGLDKSCRSALRSSGRDITVYHLVCEPSPKRAIIIKSKGKAVLAPTLGRSVCMLFECASDPCEIY
jgi:hypothetical protein